MSTGTLNAVCQYAAHKGRRYKELNEPVNPGEKCGLKIRAALDRHLYPTGEKVSRTEFENIQLKRADFHGDWNYAIKPH